MEPHESGQISLTDARKIMAACHAHATDLLNAAIKLLAEPATPNLAYHLSLLALEEVGKARLVGARASLGSLRDSTWMDKWLSSHSRKLWWALWMPSGKIDPADFGRAKVIAERLHSQRLAGLYVDPSADSPLPRDTVTLDEAQSAIDLARSLLPIIEQPTDVGSGAPPSEILEWFLRTLDDPDRSRLLFSSPFLAKYEELGGNTAHWAEWAKGEFDRLAADADAAMRQELSRQPGAMGRLKWRVRTRVYTASHTLRPKVLKFWNDKMASAVKLVFTGKKDEILIELTLTDTVPLPELYTHALGMTKMFLAFLSIGSTGYFWFEKPDYNKAAFERIDDLDRPKLKVDIGPQVSPWNNGPPTPLTEQHLYNAMVCMSTFVPMGEQAAEPIFGPYFYGLALIAKSDLHVSTDNLARTSFGASLRAALRHYHGWDGLEASFADALDSAFRNIIPEGDHRKMVFASLDPPSAGEQPISEATVMAKRLTDLFLIQTAQERWQEALRDGELGGRNA